MVASSVPSPTLKVRPVAPASVSVPLLALSVTRRTPLPASTSLMEIGLLVPVENTRAVSSLVDCGAAGTLLTGASLSGSTVMVTVATFDGAVPSSSR